ncbi:STN domain-containing protein [Sphingomonas carotinifaciens]|nr:STN domain-containing protein [Sphingomonas carotinifaciens]
MLSMLVPILAVTTSGANAQEFKYNCQNEPIAIAIPGDRLDRSIEKLRLATRCPISGTKLARGKRSKPVVGTMVPEEALQAMLNGTGLESRPIKGGFEIVRTRVR